MTELQKISSSYAPKRHLIANIYAVDLIVSAIQFAKRKQELAEEDYHKATLNHDYRTLQYHQDQKILYTGKVEGLTEALRYTLAQEASLSGYRVSEEMKEFDDEIKRLTGEI